MIVLKIVVPLDSVICKIMSFHFLVLGFLHTCPFLHELVDFVPFLKEVIESSCAALLISLS
jgi:hypothetical protein